MGHPQFLAGIRPGFRLLCRPDRRFWQNRVLQINSNLATLIRTVVILVVTALIISVRQEWKKPAVWDRTAVLFLILSGIATDCRGSVTIVRSNLVLLARGTSR